MSMLQLLCGLGQGGRACFTSNELSRTEGTRRNSKELIHLRDWQGRRAEEEIGDRYVISRERSRRRVTTIGGSVSSGRITQRALKTQHARADPPQVINPPSSHLKTHLQTLSSFKNVANAHDEIALQECNQVIMRLKWQL